MVNSYCAVEDVIRITGVKPVSLKLDKEEDPDNALETLLSKWITHSSALIDSYCNRSFDKTKDETAYIVAESVCLRITANMVALSQARKDTPLVKVNDWKVEISSAAIFTKELKDDLTPYVKEKSNNSDTVDFMAVTGD
jgi:hypothetical protein